MAAAHAVSNDNDDHLSSDQRMITTATTHHQQQQRSHDDSVPNTSTLHVVHTDAVVVHDEENDNTGHGVSSWSQTDGPRRTMRKVSRRVLPLAAAAFGISNVRDTVYTLSNTCVCEKGTVFVELISCPSPKLLISRHHEQVEKVNISLAADGIMKDLKLSASMFALASSLYFVPYGLLPVPCSLLAKRAGVRVGLASMCVAFGLVAMSTAGVQNAASLLVMRLALGATEAGVWPFVSYIISLFFGHDSMGTAIGEMQIWSAMVTIIMGPLGALFLEIGRRFSHIMSAWKWLLVLEGLPAVLAGFLILAFMPNGPLECEAFLSPKEQRYLADKVHATEMERTRRSVNLAHTSIGTGGRGTNGDTSGVMGAIRSMLRILSDMRCIALVAVQFVQAAAFMGATWFSAIILSQDGKQSMSFISAMETVNATCQTVMNYFWAKHSDRTQERLLHMIVSLSLAALGLVTTGLVIRGDGAMNAPFALLYVLYIFWQMWLQSYYTVFRAYQGDILPKASSATGFALINGLGSFGGVIGPTLAGWLRDVTGSYVIPLIALGGVLLSGAIILGVLHCCEPDVRHASKRRRSCDAHIIEPLLNEPDAT